MANQLTSVTQADFTLTRAYQVVYWREFSPGLPFPTVGLTYQPTRVDAELTASRWEAKNLRVRDGQRTTYAEIIEISAQEIEERDLVPSLPDRHHDDPQCLIHLERAN